MATPTYAVATGAHSTPPPPPEQSTPVQTRPQKKFCHELFDRTVLSHYFAGSGRGGGSTQGGAMGSSERALQPHSSGRPSCAMWDPCVVGDSNPQIQVPRWWYLFWGGQRINLACFAARSPKSRHAQRHATWMSHARGTSAPPARSWAGAVIFTRRMADSSSKRLA